MAITNNRAVRGKKPNSADVQLLTPLEAAQKLSVSTQTLAHWRVKGCGPHFVYLSSRCVRYPVQTVDEWISDRLKGSTAEAASVC